MMWRMKMNFGGFPTVERLEEARAYDLADPDGAEA
jgi:hypothetical protein